MELDISKLAIICAAFFFAGVIDAVSGGGGLLTLPAFMLCGFPAHLIAGTNQCSCLFGAITATWQYVKGRKVYWFTAVISAVVAVFGSVLGAKLNLFIPEKYLEMVMLIILPVVAILIFANKEFGSENRIDTLTKRQQAARAVLIGILGGTYTGFYGAGGGTFILLGFAVFNRLNLVTASGNMKICSTVATITASVTYALSGAVVWKAVLCAALFNIAGNYLGAKLALKNGAKIIRPMFMLVLALVFIRLVTGML